MPVADPKVQLGCKIRLSTRRRLDAALAAGHQFVVSDVVDWAINARLDMIDGKGSVDQAFAAAELRDAIERIAVIAGGVGGKSRRKGRRRAG